MGHDILHGTRHIVFVSCNSYTPRRTSYKVFNKICVKKANGSLSCPGIFLETQYRRFSVACTMHMEAACIYNIQYTNIPHACERLKELQLLLQEEVICPSIHPIIRRVQLPKETPSKSMQSNCIFLLVLRNLNAWEQKVKQQKICHWSPLNPCKIIFLFFFWSNIPKVEIGQSCLLQLAEGNEEMLNNHESQARCIYWTPLRNFWEILPFWRSLNSRSPFELLWSMSRSYICFSKSPPYVYVCIQCKMFLNIKSRQN